MEGSVKRASDSECEILFSLKALYFKSDVEENLDE